MFSVINAATNLYYENANYCEFSRPFKTIYKLCDTKPDQCEIFTLFSNAQAHILPLIEVMSSLVDIFGEGNDIDSANVFYTKTFELGHDLGKIISTIFVI